MSFNEKKTNLVKIVHDLSTNTSFKSLFLQNDDFVYYIQKNHKR